MKGPDKSDVTPGFSEAGGHMRPRAAEPDDVDAAHSAKGPTRNEHRAPPPSETVGVIDYAQRDISAAPMRRAVVGWVLYDLANTIFSMGVVTLFFPLLLRHAVGAKNADAVYGLVSAASMGTIFFISPLLGAMTDRTRTRMPFLVTATVMCVALTALLGWVEFVGALVCFGLANIAFQAGVQFYDALLPAVSTPATRGKISGIGIGVGYVGSFIAVGLGLLMASGPWRFVSIAGLFLLFALPCFVFVRERANPHPQPIDWEMVRTSTKQTLQTLRDTRDYPGLLRFLVARAFYTDAINTVISVMTLFVVNVAVAAGTAQQRGEQAAEFVMLFAISFAIAGGIAWGLLADRLGSKRVLTIVLGLWICLLAFAACIGFFALPLWTLYVLGPLAGIALGGTWAADRPYMLLLTPPARVGEFYGLYGMVGRFAAVTGPALWGLVTWAGTRAGLPVLQAEALALVALMGMVVVAAGIFATGRAAPTAP